MPRTSRPAAGRAAELYLTLAADGAAEAPDQRSLTRRLALLVAAFMLAFGGPLGWTSVAGASGGRDNQAVLVKSAGHGDDDEDNSGPGGGDGDTGEDEDDGTRGDTGQARDDDTGKETQAQNTDRPGLDTGVSTQGETDPGDNTGKTENQDSGTRGQTGQARDEQTGKETQAQNTDRPGLDTGVSTKGETDPGDHTGQTERR
jgi:hypothetical protein